MSLQDHSSFFAILRAMNRRKYGRFLPLLLLLTYLWVPVAAAYQGVAQNVFDEQNEYVVVCTANGIQLIRWGEENTPDAPQATKHCYSCLAAPFGKALAETLYTSWEIIPVLADAPILKQKKFLVPSGFSAKSCSPRAPPFPT